MRKLMVSPSGKELYINFKGGLYMELKIIHVVIFDAT